MPVRKVRGGYKWGKHGHVYKSRRGAEAQARAAYAHGYRGDSTDPEKPRSRLRKAMDRRMARRAAEISDRPETKETPVS